MINYLNHQLIKESNIIDVFEYEYWVFTCIKCKCCVFETKTISDESKKMNLIIGCIMMVNLEFQIQQKN